MMIVYDVHVARLSFYNNNYNNSNSSSKQERTIDRERERDRERRMRMREREDPQIHIKREERNLGESVCGRKDRKEGKPTNKTNSLLRKIRK